MSILVKNMKNSYTKEVPVWFMRQAGRYMEEYHLVKNKFNNFLDMCKDLDAVTEITLQPLKRFNLDAAIIFSDILIILECLDLKVDFISGIGPVVDNKNIEEKINFYSNTSGKENLIPVYEAIKRVRKELKNTTPLIGFCGAPWTLATYIIEGKISKDHSKIRKFAYKEPILMRKLIKILTDLIIDHLSKQIDSGADVIQIFETHSNSMDYYSSQLYMHEPIIKITEKIKNNYPETPIVLFSKSNNFVYNKTLLNSLNCISFGSHYRMKDYFSLVPNHICFQGNLDPMKLLAGGKELTSTVRKILHEMREKKFVFNLGHGILPETPVENVYKTIEQIKSFRS